jgi:phospholipid transport system substrate-binding protein
MLSTQAHQLPTALAALASAFIGMAIALILFAVVPSAAIGGEVFFAVESSTASEAGRSHDPKAETGELVSQALATLRDSGLSLGEKRQKLRALVAGRFDFADMARSALGYHWRELSEEQREQFVAGFTAFIEGVYLDKIQYYSGQDIVLGRERIDPPGYAEVDAKVVQQGRDAIPLGFLLRQEDTDWKIYDVTVDEISITANYRNQFSRVIEQRGLGN